MNDENIIKKCNFTEVTIKMTICMYILTAIISFVTLIIIDDTSIYTICSRTLLIISLLCLFNVSKHNLAMLIKDFKNKINIKEITTLNISLLAFSLGASFLILSLIALVNPGLADEIVNNSGSVFDYGNIFIIFLIACVIAPISEELVFRAVIFKRLSIHLNVFWGVILSSLFFSLLHGYDAMLGAFMAGIINSLLYIKYKNILLPMLVHFINNLLAVSISVLPIANNDIPFVSMSTHSLTILILISLISVVISLIFLIKFYKNNKNIFKANILITE